ncbi:MAG: alkene reductase [Spirochaetaceae bacterium]|nr:alkene reductase [Spirochaetaceae bacterium]|tara:strand:- start:37797 stop:38882 length:1086 start_codon:yes stop_codon:yes gene_type:complete
MNTLFKSYKLGEIELKNRMVMAPMTRNRSIDNIPGDIVARYYEQRSGAGLIITEGTSPSKNGLGYPRIPGIFSAEQISGWRNVTDSVHSAGGKIFVQLMHTGRIGHADNLPADGKVLGPSPIAAKGDMYTDTQGPQPHPVPVEMTERDIQDAIQEYVSAARNAIEAGFDGVEIHGANGYLVEQFLHPSANQRTDRYGGSIENRNRFALEVTRAIIDAIGSQRTGIRLSPYGVFNDLERHDEIHDQYVSLIQGLNDLNPVYVHLVDHSPMGAPQPEQRTVDAIREKYSGTLILSGGFDGALANSALEEGRGDLVAFGRPFLANPDLPERIQQGEELNEPDMATFYTPGEKGYLDYPVLAAKS